jgi:hypothetical protein
MSDSAENTPATSTAALPLAVLGDSDSHSYHDGVWFPVGSAERGGPYRSTTFQWTEVLARLRGDRFDLGAWERGGTRRTIARLQDAVGLPSRTPRKEDYRHNLAFTGAECADLMRGSARQAPRLLRLMDQAPRRWRDGIVVIRIGTNSFGKANSLDRLARHPDAEDVQATITRCIADIGEAIALLRSRHPQTRFVLVGIFDNAHWPKYFARWQSARELTNIAAGLDRFDAALKQLAQRDAAIAFFDDRGWFAQRWGTRGADGQPAYRALRLGRFVVSNSSGDHPRHSVLRDGHAGAVWNALWAQSLVELLNARFATRVRPIDDAEIVRLLDPDAALGMR